MSWKLPAFLGPRRYVDFSDDAQYPAKLEELLRDLLGAPSAVKPALGPNPFSGSRPSTGEQLLADPDLAESLAQMRQGEYVVRRRPTG